MDIHTDVILRGNTWKKAMEALKPFLAQVQQPNYSLYVISVAAGIMYDKQLDIAGVEDDDYKENRLNVPRTVLNQHNSDLDFLFQSSILTSILVQYTEDERMAFAFDPNYRNDFNKMDFLTKFGNFGVQKIFEKTSDIPLETMEELIDFLKSIFYNANFELPHVSDDMLLEP